MRARVVFGARTKRILDGTRGAPEPRGAVRVALEGGRRSRRRSELGGDRDDAALAVEEHLGDGQLRAGAHSLAKASLAPVRDIGRMHGEDQRIRKEVGKSVGMRASL